MGVLGVDNTTNTTADKHRGIPMFLRRDGDGYLVTDMVGLRYGWGLEIADAIAMWADCVQDCLDEQNAGGAYLAECEAYRSALRPHPDGDSRGIEQ